MLLYYSSIANDTHKSSRFACVVFDGEAASPNFNKVPKKLEYKLRFRDSFRTDTNFHEASAGHQQFICKQYFTKHNLEVRNVSDFSSILEYWFPWASASHQ